MAGGQRIDDEERYFESKPTRLNFDFTAVARYPVPDAPDHDREIYEGAITWLNSRQGETEQRNVEQQRPEHARAGEVFPLEDDELSFQDPVRKHDDFLSIKTTIEKDENLVDLIAQMCAKNNDNVFTFKTTDTREFTHTTGPERKTIYMSAEVVDEPGLSLEEWIVNYPKTVVLFPQYLEGTDGHPGHYWLSVLDCQARQLYVLDSISRVDPKLQNFTKIRETSDKLLISSLCYSNLNEVQLRTPRSIDRRRSLQGPPDEDNSLLYVCRWIQLFNERYYQQFLDMNYPHGTIFERHTALTTVHDQQPESVALRTLFSERQHAPMSYLSDPQWSPPNPTLDSLDEPESIRQTRPTEDLRGPGANVPVEKETMESYREWLSNQLHKVWDINSQSGMICTKKTPS